MKRTFKLYKKSDPKPIGADQSIGLVFSGGGARGAYQIGVWKAIKALGLEPRIVNVFGTSVGAINGASMLQGDLDQIVALWMQLNYESIFKDHEAMLSSANYKRKGILGAVKTVVKGKGIDVSPLKELLRSNLDEDRIRQSSLNFGMVVFDLKKVRPSYLLVNDIPYGELIEYVIASATFPLFQPHQIDGKRFIDGGVYDNRPLGFFKDDKKADVAICVDLTSARHIWKKKRIRPDLDVRYIIPSKLLGSPLAFTPKRILRNMEMGYEDGMVQLSAILTK